MDPATPAATPREHDPSSWWFVLHTKLYRYRALLRKYWWLVVFTTCAGLAASAWFVARQKIVYVSNGRMMVSGKISLPEGAIYSEEMGFFMTTQRELMQDEAVRQRAENRIRTTSPNTPISPLKLTVAPLPQTSIFVLTATGDEPEYPQKFVDAVMQEFIATRREMRMDKGETMGTAISEEIARVEADLKKEEDALIAFQRENNIGFLEQEGNSAGVFLSKLNTQFAELKNEAQLLDLFGLDQDIARKQRNDTPSDASTQRDGDLRKPVMQGPEMSYVQARQRLELLRADRADYAKDLKPKHPIMIDFDRQIAQQEQLIETFRKQSSEDLQRRRESARIEMTNLEKTIAEWSTKALDLSQRLAAYHSIQNGIAQKRTQLESLNRSKGNVEINRNVDQDVVSIRQKASVSAPQRPGVVRTIALGVSFGLLAGLLMLVLFDQIDDRVASFSEFQVHFADRVLAQIPNASRRKAGNSVDLLALDDPRHSFAEAFRSLRSSIYFLPVEGTPPKTFLITSATPNEGKSTVATNCAVTIALAGSRVLLVDGDLRRGEIHHTLHLNNERGFTDVLTGACTVEQAVQSTHLPTLSLLSRGGGVSNPGELYLSNATDRFLKDVYSQYDYILIDSSPVMAADDSTSLAPKADATIFVFRFTSSSARVSRKAIQFLRERQANVIGIVCNDVSEAMQEYYYYRYPQYYGPAKKAATT
jgi:capsular exopolysaccharide synthesis family protein